MKKNIWMYLLMILVVIFIAVAWQSMMKSKVSVVMSDGVIPEGINIGQRAPNFTLRDLQGNSVQLQDYEGMVVMLDFWAEWCPFCAGEFPVMQEAYRKYQDEGFVILGIHRTSTESAATAEKFVKTVGATFPILLDNDDEVYKRFIKVPVMPASVFIDREGIIQNIIFGPKDLQTLDGEIQSLL